MKHGGASLIDSPNPDEPDWDDAFDSLSDPLDSWGQSQDADLDEQWACEPWGDLTLFRPEGQESSYAYPLLIWLSIDATPGVTLRDWFPDLSERNYVGVEVPCHGMPALAQRVEQAIHEAGRFSNIHPQRIWLAGRGAAADAALACLPLLAPVIAGVVALHPTHPVPAIESACSAAPFVTLYLALTGPRESEADQVSAAWRDAGGDCRCVLTVPDDAEERLAICSDLNVWLMEQVTAPVAR